MRGRSKETTGRSLLVAAARGALTFLPPTIMKTFHRATAASWRKSDTAVQEGVTTRIARWKPERVKRISREPLLTRQ